MSTRTLLTVNEFLNLPIHEGSVYELSRGELITMTPGRPRHNRVRDRLARQLMDFVERHKLGEIFVETEFQLTSDTIRIPDAALVTVAALQTIDLDQPIAGAPALAIEVVSPNDLAEELATKVDQIFFRGRFGGVGNLSQGPRNPCFPKRKDHAASGSARHAQRCRAVAGILSGGRHSV